MKNTQLNTVSANNILVLNADQITNLVDLVDDQIRAQRVYLRHSDLKKTSIGALTHFRHLKRVLIAKECEILRQEAKEEAESRENAEIFEIFKS